MLGDQSTNYETSENILHLYFPIRGSDYIIKRLELVVLILIFLKKEKGKE